MTQAGTPRATLVAGDGPVTMALDVTDPNVADTHTFDWSATESALVPNEGFGAATFTFDPSGLADGTYAVRVTVTDDGSPSTSASLVRLLRVVTTPPVLAAGVDSDGGPGSAFRHPLHQPLLFVHYFPEIHLHAVTALFGFRYSYGIYSVGI